MKLTLSILVLICVIAVSFAGCEFRPPPKHCEDVAAFSYEEDLAMLDESTKRVERDGFVNATALDHVIEIDIEALDRAERECTFHCTNYTYYYDQTLRVWKIEFWKTRNAEGYPQYIYQTVYLSHVGVTLLVVYDDT